MKFTFIQLTGYVGFKHGLLKDKIFIDFTKCKSKIVTILGGNGSGKSTLLKALSIFPNDNSMFLPKSYAEKAIGLMDGPTEYNILIQHPIDISKTKIDEFGEPVVTRLTTKAYIKKRIGNGWVELNPTGSVNNYREIINAEFSLDANFETLSSLSTEDKGIVDKTPAERKKYVNAIISQVEAYNNINKTLTKRNSINRSLMNKLTSKIESLGNEENLINTLNSVLARIEILKVNRDNLIKNIAEVDSTIKILDPDQSIQNLYNTIQVELERVDSEISKLSNSSSYLHSNLDFKSSDSDFILKEREKLNKILNKTESDISSIEDSIADLFNRREDEARNIQLKVQRLDSLKSEFNFIDLENTIKTYRDDIARYEKIFEDIHIQNAISISKDEYITGLNTMMNIKEMIDAIYSSNENHIVVDSVNYILSNTDVLSLKTKLENSIESDRITLEKLSMDYTLCMAKNETLQLLTKRPNNCSVDTCPFISEAVKISKEKTNPLEEAEKINELMRHIKESISTSENTIKYLEECLFVIKDLKIILRTVDNNKVILNKLPYKEIFLNSNEFLQRIADRDRFNEITSLYEYINYANIFEEYKIAKDGLYKLEVDYQIYQSKNEVIKELSKDIDTLQEKLSGIINTITENNDKISSLKVLCESIKNKLSDVDTLININNKIKDQNNKKEDLITRLNAISSNMEKIKANLTNKESMLVNLANINKELTPLEEDRDRLKFSLVNYQQYKEELAAITESYNMIEVIKKFSSPTKNGIQNLFITVYMNQTLKLANDLLGLFFDGQIILTRYNISESDFSIECYSKYANMPIDDVSACSRSQKTMASLAISTALMKQSSSIYNILRLDEIDEGLDARNRLVYIEGVHTLIDLLNIEQCFMVSHSSELGLGLTDVIKLTSDNGVIANEGNVIFDASI